MHISLLFLRNQYRFCQAQTGALCIDMLLDAHHLYIAQQATNSCVVIYMRDCTQQQKALVLLSVLLYVCSICQISV